MQCAFIWQKSKDVAQKAPSEVEGEKTYKWHYPAPRSGQGRGREETGSEKQGQEMVILVTLAAMLLHVA